MWYLEYKDTHVPNTSFMSYLSSTVGVLATLGASSFIFSLGLAFPKRGISVVLVCRPDCLCWCLALWRAHCVRRARSSVLALDRTRLFLSLVLTQIQISNTPPPATQLK